MTTRSPKKDKTNDSPGRTPKFFKPADTLPVIAVGSFAALVLLYSIAEFQGPDANGHFHPLLFKAALALFITFAISAVIGWFCYTWRSLGEPDPEKVRD